MVSLLNPEAPEFFPSHNHKLQQQQLPYPNFSTSHHFFFIVSAYPSRQLHHPFYYPTTTLPPPPPSIPFHDATITNPLALEAEPAPFHNIKDDPNPVDEPHAVHQKKGQVLVAEPKTGGSKGLVQKQVFKPYGSFRMKSYPPRRKFEEDGQRKSVDFLRNKCFRGFPKRKPYSPLMPVSDGGNETTVMIRNIPSKYTRGTLVEFLEKHCKQVNVREEAADKEKGEESSYLAFDFVYLPIDFKTGMNKGYAFVNFTKPKAAWKFLMTASNSKWDLFQSHKIREVVAARLQGKEKLERHFETMNFPCDSEDVLPVSFSPPRDGVNKGEQRTTGNLMKRQQV